MDKLINSDGKQYRFSPGKNGSLTNVSNSATQEDMFNRPKISKVVPALQGMRKRRMAAQVATARG